MTDIDVTFCRLLLREVHKTVKLHFPDINLRKSASVWHFMRDHWEFHGPDEFYWHGSAANAFDARYKGWNAYLRSKGIGE